MDPQKALNTLTANERADWCEWFVSAIGSSPEGLAPVDDKGCTFGGGCQLGHEFMCDAQVPRLPRLSCEANLSLTTCDAPLSELTDCVATVQDGCWPSPHGCARYLDRPGCDGTVVRANADDSQHWCSAETSELTAACSVRVQ